MYLKRRIIEALTDFMTEKAKDLIELTGEPKCMELYWLPEDGKLFEEFSEEDLKYAVYWLYKEYREGGIFFATLRHESCPFCLIVAPDCKECPYGKKKGFCDEKGSDFSEVRELVLAEFGANRTWDILEELDAREAFERSGLKELAEELILRQELQTVPWLTAKDRERLQDYFRELFVKEV